MPEMSIYIAANSLEDARAIFEECAELAKSGQPREGSLIPSPLPGGGCAQLYVFPEKGP